MSGRDQGRRLIGRKSRRAEIFALPTATSRRSAADIDAQGSYRLS
jgi:hypothetical protein